MSEEKGTTTLRIYQYWIFHRTIIKTCFEIPKSTKHKKSWRYSNYKSPNFFRLFWSYISFSSKYILVLNSKNRGPWICVLIKLIDNIKQKLWHNFLKSDSVLKRYSTLEEHDWLKSLHFIAIGWNPWIKKGFHYLCCKEKKGGLKDIHYIAQNAELFVSLL